MYIILYCMQIEIVSVRVSVFLTLFWRVVVFFLKFTIDILLTEITVFNEHDFTWLLSYIHIKLPLSIVDKVQYRLLTKLRYTFYKKKQKQIDLNLLRRGYVTSHQLFSVHYLYIHSLSWPNYITIPSKRQKGNSCTSSYCALCSVGIWFNIIIVIIV